MADDDGFSDEQRIANLIEANTLLGQEKADLRLKAKLADQKARTALHDLDVALKRISELHKELGRRGDTIGALRAELSRLREDTSKIERGQLHWAERQVEILQGQHVHDLNVIERQREEMAKLQRHEDRELRKQLWGLVVDWGKEKSDPVTEHALGAAAKELRVILTYPEAETADEATEELADEAEAGYEVTAGA